MLRLGNRLRLADADLARLTALTGTSPAGITSADGLNRFVEAHLPVVAGDTPEARLLTLLLEDEKVDLV